MLKLGNNVGAYKYFMQSWSRDQNVQPKIGKKLTNSNRYMDINEKLIIDIK